jgi:hypothetical protein
VRDFDRLGLTLHPLLKNEILGTGGNARSKRRRQPARTNDDIPSGYGEWWDDDFAFIAGHTSGGAPFGTRWDELETESNLPSSDCFDCESRVQFREPSPFEDPEYGDDIPEAVLADDEDPF